MIGRAFGQGYFGGSPSTSPFVIVSGGRSRTLVLHLDADVAASGMATQATDFSFPVRPTQMVFTVRNTNAVITARVTNVVLPVRSTNAVPTSQPTDTTDFDWQVSP